MIENRTKTEEPQEGNFVSQLSTQVHTPHVLGGMTAAGGATYSEIFESDRISKDDYNFNSRRLRRCHGLCYNCPCWLTVTLPAIRPRNLLQKITNNHTDMWLSIRELLPKKIISNIIANCDNRKVREVRLLLLFHRYVACRSPEVLTLWGPLLPYGYSYKSSCARPG